MFRFQIAWRRNVRSVLIVLWELLRHGLQFMSVVARPRTGAAAEVLFLRKQLAYYQDHHIRPRRLTDVARLSVVLWSRLFDWKEALAIVTPATFVRWHRRGFRLYWRWKSRGSRPQLPKEIRLIARLVRENVTWREEQVADELYCERLVGTMRRECLDFMIPLHERHPRMTLRSWIAHYNKGRPHSSLGPGIHRQPWSVLCHDQRFTGTDCHLTVRLARRRTWAVYITNIGWNRVLPEPPKVSAEDRCLPEGGPNDAAIRRARQTLKFSPAAVQRMAGMSAKNRLLCYGIVKTGPAR
jgi:Integrase core domain